VTAEPEADSMQLAIDLVQRAREDEWKRKSLQSLAHRIIQELLRHTQSDDTSDDDQAIS
jgi:hypothetical protein